MPNKRVWNIGNLPAFNNGALKNRKTSSGKGEMKC